MIFLDFEFNNITSPTLNLVCCTTYDSDADETIDWWLHYDSYRQKELRDYLQGKKVAIFVGYAMIAEARSMLALGLNPTEYRMVDQFLEYRCLTNHNDALNWGNQLVDGKVKFTKKPPPKWERTEDDMLNSFKPTHSLAECTYKLLGEIRDTDHKNRMRDIIISGNVTEIENNKDSIQAYCREDVVFLPLIQSAILREYKNLGVPFTVNLMKQMNERAHYSALTAKMEAVGYPIDYEATKNFAASVGPILEDCQREINRLFPHIKPFKYSPKTGKFTWDQTVTKEWLRDNVDISRWLKTDGHKKAVKEAKAKKIKLENEHKYLSLSGDAWQKVFDYKHEYPKDVFGAQMVRYLKLKKDLNGFLPTTGTKKSFWDAVGPDQRVRPYYNIFGSQSSRSQPSSRSYLFLKPAWMRSLCKPAKGKAIASFDYGSEEYLISALISDCKNMQESYKSGDVYLYFAKLAGMVPWDGTKDKYKAERNLCKALVLGISYLMTAKGLAGHLTNNTGKPYTEEDAQELIDQFYEAYEELDEWQRGIVEEYEDEKKLMLPDGWYIWGDNENFRSVCNVPIQGMGAVIMRKAVDLCDKAGLTVIMTLHDALYIEYDAFDFAKLDIFYRCMREAFMFYFPDQQEMAGEIKLDGYTWSREYPEIKIIPDPKDSYKFGLDCESITTPGGLEIDLGHMYIDERSVGEYMQFRKYFKEQKVSAL